MSRPAPAVAALAVQKARSRLGYEPYDAVTANCEHFVNGVVYGRPTSGQVQAAVGFGLLALAVGILSSMK